MNGMSLMICCVHRVIWAPADSEFFRLATFPFIRPFIQQMWLVALVVWNNNLFCLSGASVQPDTCSFHSQSGRRLKARQWLWVKWQLKSDELQCWALHWNMRWQLRDKWRWIISPRLQRVAWTFLFIHPSISLLFVCCRQCITLKYKFPPSKSLPLQQFRLKATELLICKLHFIPNDIISTLRS